MIGISSLDPNDTHDSTHPRCVVKVAFAWTSEAFVLLISSLHNNQPMSLYKPSLITCTQHLYSVVLIINFTRFHVTLQDYKHTINYSSHYSTMRVGWDDRGGREHQWR